MTLSLATLGVSDAEVLKQISAFQTWEDFVSVGIDVRQYKDRAQWILGCLAAGVEKKYGEDSIGKYAKTIGVPVASLNTYRWVVKQYTDVNPEFVPPESTSFGVLQAIAGLPKEAREQLLERAELDGMTVEGARAEATSTKKNGKVRPKFQTVFCSVHQKWQFVPENIEDWEGYHDA